MSKQRLEKVPRSEWTPDEIEFDALVDGMESRLQLSRIDARQKFAQFEKRFTKEQMDAMWLRINGEKVQR